MNNNRVIGIELVVDDKGTVKLVKFAESAKQAFGQAERSAEGLDASMAKGARRARQTEGAMADVERRAGTLTSKVKLIGAGFESLYRTGKSAFDRLHQAGRGAFNRLHRAGSVFWNATRRITSGIFSLKGALIGLGLGYVANDFLKVADNTDRMKIALDQLTNGKGEEWFRKLNDWAFKMPVNTDKAIEAFIRLRAFGLEPTIKQMTTLVDSTIGVGRGEEALESVSRALGQIQARGKLSAEELNQLAEAGISAKSMLADAFGVSVANLEKLIAKGIDSKVAIAALFDQLEARFGGASSKIQQKYSGLMDALISHWRDFQRQMMESGVMQAIERSLGRIIGKLDELRSSGRIAEWADKAGKAIESLVNRAGNFIDGVINNWGKWEARWEKFKSGASEVWTQTKDVASAVGSLLKVALDGWNNLPPVVREFGLVGALIGGIKGKLIFSAIVGLSALLDKAKEVSKGEPDLHIGGITVPGSPERGYLFKFRQWLEELKGQEPTQSLRELNAGYYRKDYYPTGPMGGGMGGPTAQGLGDLGIPEPGLPAATSAAGTSPSKTSPTRFTVPTGDDEKALAKREAAGLKAVKEYMAAVEEANKLEVSLRQETMTSYEKSFDDLKRGYTSTYDKIEDLEYRGAITSEQALDMRRQASSNYLTARDKMEADHNRGLLRKIEEFGKSGRELQKVQLAHEIEDLQKAGYDKELIRQYTAQRMYEIDKSMLVKTLEAWTNTDQLIADGTKSLMDGLQQEWTGFFTKVFDNGLSNIEDSFGDFCDAVFGMWKQMLAQFVAQWTLSGFAGIMLGLINLLKGGEFTFNLNGGDSGGASTLLKAGSAIKSGYEIYTGGGTVAEAIASMFGGGTGAAWLGTEAMTGAEAALGSSAAMESAFFGSTAGEIAATTAAETAAEMAAIDAGAAPAAGAGLGATAIAGGAIAAIAGGAILTFMGAFGAFDDDRSPKEKALQDWFGGRPTENGPSKGSSGYINAMIDQLKATGSTPVGVGAGSGFSEFGQSAQEAAAALENLVNVAGMTQAQVDALVGSMDPLAQEFIKSGQQAKSLQGKVSGLAQEMNAAINSYAMTSDAVNMYNDRIDKLAADMGLTGQAANKFKNEIWDLANSFSQGGEEAGRFDKALNDFVGTTLGGIAEGANSASEAVGGLIGTMQNASVVGNTFSSSLPRGGGSTSSAGSTVGVYHQGGLVRHSGGDIGNWGWASYEQLMRLAGDEVLTKLQMGEYVVQAGAVNSLTGPWLDQVNDTGQPPVLAAPVTVPMPVATSGPGSQGKRTVVIEEGAVTVVVQGGDMDEDALALRLRDRLAELARDAFEAV